MLDAQGLQGMYKFEILQESLMHISLVGHTWTLFEELSAKQRIFRDIAFYGLERVSDDWKKIARFSGLVWFSLLLIISLINFHLRRHSKLKSIKLLFYYELINLICNCWEYFQNTDQILEGLLNYFNCILKFLNEFL